jgi:hypothetical protein
MTPQDAFCELLARLGASKGAAVLISGEELNHWPAVAIRAMKSRNLLVKARPAASVVCHGCEQECVMPVHTRPAETRIASPFIVCDKRSDINRVAVPIIRLEQWQASGRAIANLLAALLGLRSPDSGDTSTGRWEVGVFKGAKGSSHLVLLADGRLTLTLGGYSIPLADFLVLGDNGFTLDRRTLTRMVDKPVGGAGVGESAAQRRARLTKRVQTEKNRNNKTFLKTVAEEERISVSRLKQLLEKKDKPTKNRPRLPAY